MSRPVVRTLLAAAVTTAALVAVPQAAFANMPATDPGTGGVHIGVLVGPPTTVDTTAPRVAPRKPSAPRTPTTTTRTTTGSDISYPQCSVTPPANQLFGVIGVNGGTAKDFNPCLGTQFDWAAKTTGTVPQGTASLYVNTANPGSRSSWWPKSDMDRPTVDAAVAGPRNPLPDTPITYPGGGTPGCSSEVDPFGPACSYVYGYVRAEQAVAYAQEQLGEAYSAKVRWWLDVETTNTWAGPTTSNAASLAGAATSLLRVGQAADGVGRVGVYSSTAQYSAITGGTGSAVPNLPDGGRSPLIGLPEWGAGASDLEGAKSNCGVTAFTGGAITLTQFVSGTLDYDVSCGGY
jgi:hypothetical protein